MATTRETPAAINEVAPEFIYPHKQSGKNTVRYAGLLDLAHRKGIRSMTTELLQSPNKEQNGGVAIVKARVELASGVYEAIGDAFRANVNANMADAIIRIAETRAKARALRDALNITGAAIEGEPDEDDQE